MCQEPNSKQEGCLLAEYGAAHDSFFHHDNLSWQVGTVLTAGTFILWGILIDKEPKRGEAVILSLAVCLLMALWALWVHQNQQIYLFKLHRICEIERLLGLQQNLRFWFCTPDSGRLYKVRGPRGSRLFACTYVLASLGTPLMAALRDETRCLWLFIPLPVVVLVLAWIWHNEKVTKSYIKGLWQSPGPEPGCQSCPAPSSPEAAGGAHVSGGK